MAQYNGIIAGIGDLENGINVINPQFDARVNNFIIGANGVIEGLEISGNILSAGMCVAQGYRGSIDTDITLDITTYVYGVFKVYHDPEILDEFYIQTSSTPLDSGSTGNSFGDDILYEAGTYYLRLNNRLQYPINAVNSENTDEINYSGKIGNGTTAVTQAVNDNSDKVATTKFVHDLLDEEVNYTEDTIYAHYNSRQYATIKLTKKAGYVIAEVIGDFINNTNANAVTIDNIPTEFLPINGYAYLILPFAYSGGTNYNVGIDMYAINSNGTTTYINQGISINVKTGISSSEARDYVTSTHYSGWETNI